MATDPSDDLVASAATHAAASYQRVKAEFGLRPGEAVLIVLGSYVDAEGRFPDRMVAEVTRAVIKLAQADQQARYAKALGVQPRQEKP